MKAAIIGSGIGGLATAVQLAKRGYEVHVFEKNHTYGGKMSEFNLGNYRFDGGPSLFTMPHFVTEILDKDLLQEFEIIQLHHICHYFFSNGQSFQANASKEQFISDAAIQFNEPEKNIRQFLNKAEKIYNITAPVFLQSSLHKLNTYICKSGLYGILNLWRIDMFRSMNQSIESNFNNKNLIQLFNRYATYNGSNPYIAPATLNVISHLEFHYGAYLPKKGMRQIADILHKQAVRNGVSFHFNTEISHIQKSKNQLHNIVCTDGQLYNSDIFVSNVDAKLFYSKLLKVNVPQKIKKAENSSSALIFYWGIKRQFPELDVHNILFSNNYESEFDAIFNTKTVQDDPTVYINITSKKINSDAPTGCENWFVMINAPYNDGQDWELFRRKARANIIQKINKTLHTNIEELIEEETYLDPVLIENNTGSNKGSLYGSSSNHRMSAFFRQSNFSNEFKNLYFCGGSVHPGGGIPLCMLSAKIISDIVPHANR